MQVDRINTEPYRILLIQDNEAHAQLISRNLRNHEVPIVVQHAPDGEAALDYLFSRNKPPETPPNPRPHLVLLDLRLPKIDGLEVLKAIKDSPELKTLTVVVLTTSESENDVALAYEYHANSYLVKPVDFAKFTKLMNDTVYYWLVWNQQSQP